MDRAAGLIEAYAGRPTSAAHAADAANARARVLQTLHVGAHVSAAALREHEGRPNPALAGQRFTLSPAQVVPGLEGSIALARSLTFEALEAAAADAVSRNGFERIRIHTSEERDRRLTDSLAAWTEVSQSLLAQKVPAADDWVTITRTYADISVHAVVLLHAAADRGVINGDEFQVLAPQLHAMHDGWAAAQAAWPSHLRTTQVHVDPTLRDARSNLTQTLNSLTHDGATWAEPATIAGHCDLPMVITDLRTSLRGSSQSARDLGALPERLVAAGALRGAASKLNDLLPPKSRRPQVGARKVVDVCTVHLEPLGLSTAATAQAQRVDQVLAGMENTPDPRTAGAVRPPAQLGYGAVERAALPDGVDPAQLLADRDELAVGEAVEDGPDLARAVIDDRIAERGRARSVAERVSAARHAAQVLPPLGQDKWVQHIAYIAEQVDVAPTTVHVMVVEAVVAGGDGHGGLVRHDLLEDLDCVQSVARIVVDIAGEGLTTTFVARLALVPGAGRGQVQPD